MNSRERIEQLNKLKIALQAVLELRKEIEEQDTQEEQVGIVQNKTSKRQLFRRSTLKNMHSLSLARRHPQQEQPQSQKTKTGPYKRTFIHTIYER